MSRRLLHLCPVCRSPIHVRRRTDSDLVIKVLADGNYEVLRDQDDGYTDVSCSKDASHILSFEHKYSAMEIMNNIFD